MTKTELLKFIENNKENYSIQLKRLHKDLFEKIDKLYNFTSFGQKVYHYLNDGIDVGKCEICNKLCKFDSFCKGYRKRCSYVCMGKGKFIKSHETRRCVVCEGGFEVYKHRKKTTCSEKCLLELNSTDEVNKKRMESLKNTMVKKYGVDHPSKLLDFKSKLKHTKLIKYGDENYVNVEKSKITKQNKYGSEKYNNSEKLKQTCILKYGVDNFSKTKKFKQSHMENVISRLNFLDLHPLFDIDSYNGVVGEHYKFKCKKCNNIFESYLDNGHNPICLVCNPSLKSKPQQEIYDYLKSILTNDVEINQNIRSVLSDMGEIDIYIPTLNLGIECDGIYWHSELAGGKDKHYHLNKTQKCIDKGIQLMHIWDWEWKCKRNIIKSVLLNRVGKSKKIYARNCIVKEVVNQEKTKFLENNHMQGDDRSSIRLGLYCGDELVSLMTFVKSRYDKKYQYELSRFCNKIYTNVIGGSSKLFTYFVKNYDVRSIVTYSDRRLFTGKVYENLGMTFVDNTPPGYHYFHKNNNAPIERIHFQKHKLKEKLEKFDGDLSEWQNMRLNSYDRIWDCGHLKYEWIRK